MLLPDLIRTVESNADSLADGLLSELRADPRTSYLHAVGEGEVRRRLVDLYANLARWVGERNEGAIEAAYSELGRVRAREGVAASELVHALLRAKDHLIDFVRRNGSIETAIERQQEDELLDMVGRFFDRAVYHAVRGHESVGAGAGHARRAPTRW